MKQTEIVVLGLYTVCMVGGIGYLVMGDSLSSGQVGGATSLLLVMAILIPFVPPL